jgi:hydroxymethylpyrimidine pyrophosphatase-like HAD family hydrolase
VQAESEQRPHKLSYYVSSKGGEAQALISHLQQALSDAGVKAKLIYSGGVDLDILPENASKGKGLEFLLRQVLPPKQHHESILTA